MIPLCARENIKYSEDGINYKFIPMTGLLESELMALGEDFKEKTQADIIKLVDIFFDKICLEITSTEHKLPAYTKPSELYNNSEKCAVIFQMWRKANAVTIEEKKS